MAPEGDLNAVPLTALEAATALAQQASAWLAHRASYLLATMKVDPLVWEGVLTKARSLGWAELQRLLVMRHSCRITGMFRDPTLPGWTATHHARCIADGLGRTVEHT